ncbi:MAG TPA: tetratricopeptide repeat protein [Gemmataceae bacterium]|nr:tetratricopeptide repeat protein [Gemmataceae bacterium]
MSTFFFAAAVFLPLIVLLVLHETGGLQVLVRRLTPTGRALERNKAGMALFHRGGYVAAVAEFTDALRLHPRLAAALTNRGVAYYHLGKLDEARADLDAALSLAPNLVDAISWRGLILAQQGGHERALEDLDRAIALGAREGVHFATRGGILLAKNDYDRALSDCTEAILRGSSGAADFSNRGMAYLGKGDCERAIADFDEAIRRDERCGLAFNNRGVALLKQGAYARASADFHEAMRLSPSLPNPYKNLAWLMATCPQAEFRDGASAVAQAQKALQLVDQKVTEWFGILAAAYAEAGDFAQAIAWQTQCLDRSPAKMKKELESRLDLYKSRRPYRETPDGANKTTSIIAARHSVRA